MTEAETGVMWPGTKGWRGESHGQNSPSGPPEGAGPANTLISDFWSPEPWECKFVLFLHLQFVVLCHSNPRTLMSKAVIHILIRAFGAMALIYTIYCISYAFIYIKR